MWYTFFGGIVTIVTGLVVSGLTGGLNNRVDRSLLVFDLTACFNNEPKQEKDCDDYSLGGVSDFDLKEPF
jgi:hypothetical protein